MRRMNRKKRRQKRRRRRLMTTIMVTIMANIKKKCLQKSKKMVIMTMRATGSKIKMIRKVMQKATKQKMRMRITMVSSSTMWRKILIWR